MRELRINDVPPELHMMIRMATAGSDTTIRLMVIKILEDHVAEYIPKMEEIQKVKRRKIATT